MTVLARGHLSCLLDSPASRQREIRNRRQGLEVSPGSESLFIPLCAPSVLVTFSGIWPFSLLLVSTSSAFLKNSSWNSFVLVSFHPPNPMKQVWLPFCNKKTKAQRSSVTFSWSHLAVYKAHVKFMYMNFILGHPMSRSYLFCLKLVCDNI